MLGAVVQKVVVMPHLGGVMAMRGPLDLLPELSKIVLSFASVDDMARDLPNDLRILYGPRSRKIPDIGISIY